MTPEPQSRAWEEQFDKLADGVYGYIHQYGHGKLKAFITRTIAAAVAEERERVRGVVENGIEEIRAAIEPLNLDYWQHSAEKKCEYQAALQEIKPIADAVLAALSEETIEN